MLVFENAVLLDGTGAPPRAGMSVLVRGAKIEAVGQGLPVPDGARVIDLAGRVLLPGFSDAHTHFGGSARLDRPGLAGRFESYDFAEHREAALSWGVTAVRSAGDFTPEILCFRDEVNAGKIRSPRIVAAGKMVQAKDGHPLSTVFFENQAIREQAIVLVEEDTDIEEQIRLLAEAGVDWIKAFVSDDNKMKYPCTVPRLSSEQLRRIVDAAHKYGKPVMMHADDIGNLSDAVLAGADSVEHTINVATSDHEMTDEVLSLLTSRDVWVVPTMTANRLHEGSVPGAPPVYPALETAVRRMVEAGVKLGVGCDSGIPFIPYGECVHMEMELLTSVGMTPLAAVTAATGGNAKLFRKEGEFGTVEPGKAADLVVLGSDPLADIRNTRDIRIVLRDGAVVVDRLLAE